MALSSSAIAVLWALQGTFAVVATPVSVTATRTLEDGTTSTSTDLLHPLDGILPFALMSLLPAALSAVLSRAAMDRIRAGWPQLYGVGAAVTGAWLLPLFALNVAVGLVLALPVLERRAYLDPLWGLAFALASLAFDAAWIAWRRRRILRILAG